METHIFHGGSKTENGEFHFSPLPHIPDGFLFSINGENFPFRAEILMKIFQTVSPTFRPFLPDFSFDSPFEIACREYQKSLEGLFENHGMPQIKIRVEESVREIHQKNRKGKDL